MRRVKYINLNSRQKENFNFQKISAVLADYGFATIRLSDDWQGADFIAQHIDGVTFRKVQLKGRLTFGKKYFGRQLYICFPSAGSWYLYPHDKLLKKLEQQFSHTKSWRERSGYNFRSLSAANNKILQRYAL